MNSQDGIASFVSRFRRQEPISFTFACLVGRVQGFVSTALRQKLPSGNSNHSVIIGQPYERGRPSANISSSPYSDIQLRESRYLITANQPHPQGPFPALRGPCLIPPRTDLSHIYSAISVDYSTSPCVTVISLIICAVAQGKESHPLTQEVRDPFSTPPPPTTTNTITHHHPLASPLRTPAPPLYCAIDSFLPSHVPASCESLLTCLPT